MRETIRLLQEWPFQKQNMKKAWLTFCSVSHPRLGAISPAKTMTELTLKKIFKYLKPSDFPAKTEPEHLVKPAPKKSQQIVTPSQNKLTNQPTKTIVPMETASPLQQFTQQSKTPLLTTLAQNTDTHPIIFKHPSARLSTTFQQIIVTAKNFLGNRKIQVAAATLAFVGLAAWRIFKR